MSLEIIKYPDPILKKVSEEVKDIDSGILAFIDGLVGAMKASPGVGLAAPQVGVLKRIIAVDIGPKVPSNGLTVLINPFIVSSSGIKTGREGCLSVPEFTANIERATEAVVKGLTAQGREIIITSSGFEAVVFQHEIDHLDGILFIDRIANMKRDLFKRKIKDL